MRDRDIQNQPDRTVLPPPESPFKGKIETAMKNSTQDWPQSLKAPEGAPNVLMIIGDDIGFGTPTAFGGPVNTQPQKDASGGRIQPLAQQSNAFLRQLAPNLKFHPWLQSLRSTTAFGG